MTQLRMMRMRSASVSFESDLIVLAVHVSHGGVHRLDICR